jgi:hypothetical protein
VVPGHSLDVELGKVPDSFSHLHPLIPNSPTPDLGPSWHRDPYMYTR